MGRRRRRVIKVVKKKLPSVFVCPRCGEEAVRVMLPRGGGSATVQCGSCGLKEQFQASAATQQVDVYCWFTDKFYGASLGKERLVTAVTASTQTSAALIPGSSDAKLSSPREDKLPEQTVEEAEAQQEESIEAPHAEMENDEPTEPSTVPDFTFDDAPEEKTPPTKRDEAKSSQQSSSDEEDAE